MHPFATKVLATDLHSAGLRLSRLFSWADKLEEAQSLDRYVAPLANAVRRALPSRRVRNALHGVPLGHPAHPILVQLPIGAWASAGILDLLPGTRRSATVLTAVGVAAATPAALSGLNDWAELRRNQQRVGLVHAGLNTAALGFYSASLLARLRSRGARARLYGYAGLATVGVSGYLGGHLSYRMSAGANHAEAVPHLVPAGWHDLGELADLPDGRLTRREIEGTPVLVLRRGAGVHVLADRCSHLDGPLSEGSIVRDDEGGPCVSCPWHGSTFRLADGSVYAGPATAPQPVFLVEVESGRVRVRLPQGGRQNVGEHDGDRVPRQNGGRPADAHDIGTRPRGREATAPEGDTTWA